MTSFLLVGCQSSKIASKEELGNRFQLALKSQDPDEFKSLTILSLSDKEIEKQLARPVFEVESQGNPGLKEADFQKIFTKDILPEFKKVQKNFGSLFDKLVKKTHWIKEAEQVAIKAGDFTPDREAPIEAGTLRLYFKLSEKKEPKMIDLPIANLSKRGWVIADEPSVVVDTRGAAQGAVLGGILGAVIGHNTKGKKTAEGAAIGALGGAVLGGALGNSQDKKAGNK